MKMYPNVESFRPESFGDFGHVNRHAGKVKESHEHIPDHGSNEREVFLRGRIQSIYSVKKCPPLALKRLARLATFCTQGGKEERQQKAPGQST